MQVNEERARAQAQLYVAHYRRGLGYALTKKGPDITTDDTSEMRIANHHAIHARGTVKNYVSDAIVALNETKSAAGHHLGLSPTELGIINDAFWNKVSAAIGLDEKEIREDVECMDRIAQLASVFQSLSLAQYYEGRQGEERFAANYLTDSRQILKHLYPNETVFEQMDTKELIRNIKAAIMIERGSLKARPRKPTGEFRIYGHQAQIRAEA